MSVIDFRPEMLSRYKFAQANRGQFKRDMNRWSGFVLLSLTLSLTACGESGNNDDENQPAIASVTLSPETWDADRIGQRQQLTATARDSLGDPIPGVEFSWESSATDVAKVDANGKVTAFKVGSAEVVVTAEGETATTSLTVTSELESATSGLMYTVWFARSDDAPALLVDGKLEVAEDMYCQTNDRDWVVCPGGVNFSNDYNNDSNYPNRPNPPDPTTPWSHPDVEKFQWEGDRIGLLSDMSAGQGTFRVIDRATEWKTLAIGNVTDFQLEGKRIGVLIDNSQLRVKEGGLSAPWTVVTNLGEVQQFQLAGERIGVLYPGGRLKAKEGGLSAPWTVVTDLGEVQQFQLEGDRIGVLYPGGQLKVKEGSLSAPWTVVTDLGEVQQFQLEGDRIGVLYPSGQLKVKEGGLSAPWTVEIDIGEVQQFQLEGDRIGVLFPSGRFLVKEGDLSAPWTVVAKAGSGVQQMQLQENYVGALFEDGTLSIKEDLNGEWRNTTTAYGSGKISQFRLIVDVPVPPSRTTPDLFTENLRICSGQETENGEKTICYTARTYIDTNPGDDFTDFYGRFCGKSNPGAGVNWDWAVNPGEGGGPMDPMDALCMHHDAAYKCPCDSDPDPSVGWYPAGESGIEYLCVVRYGLENARLTKNGVTIDKTERDNWSGDFDRLYETIYSGGRSFWTGAATGCPTTIAYSFVEVFTDATKAKHNN